MEKQDILKIGVTGSAGSGKSLVLKAFNDFGLVTLDCDQIARDVVEPGEKGYLGVKKIFGPDVVGRDGALDRSLMRSRILDDPGLRGQLEGLLHPLIIRKLVDDMETAEYGKEFACAVEVPLLFELEMEKFFDVTLVVISHEKTLLQRIINRDHVEMDSAKKMISLQMSQADKMARCDYVVENKGGRGELVDSVRNLYSKIKKEFLTRNR